MPPLGVVDFTCDDTSELLPIDIVSCIDVEFCATAGNGNVGIIGAIDGPMLATNEASDMDKEDSSPDLGGGVGGSGVDTGSVVIVVEKTGC